MSLVIKPKSFNDDTMKWGHIEWCAIWMVNNSPYVGTKCNCSMNMSRIMSSVNHCFRCVTRPVWSTWGTSQGSHQPVSVWVASGRHWLITYICQSPLIPSVLSVCPSICTSLHPSIRMSVRLLLYLSAVSLRQQVLSSPLLSTYKFEGPFFRHEYRIATKFGTHVRIETRLALT